MKEFDRDKKWSLVLGGGAARGLTFLGIYKWLEEHNYYPNEVVGNSAGSIIGACISAGIPFEEVFSFAKEVHRKKLLDLNFRWGLLGGKKVNKIFDNLFGDIKIEDCKIPFKCVAVDINKCDKIIISKGKIKDGVRASISIPFIFQPHKIGQKILVDGGIMCNLPIEYSRYQQVLAASSLKKVSKPISITKQKNGKTRKHGFFGLNTQIIRRVFLSIVHSNEEKSVLLGQIKNKDLTLIKPTPEIFKHHEFHKVEEMVEAGYQYMVDNFGK